MSTLFAPQLLPRAERGAIYALGRHRLACSDATDKAAVAALFAGRKPTLVVTSPPYADARDYNDPIECWRHMMVEALHGHVLADDAQMLINLGLIHRKEQLVQYWQGWLSDMQTWGHRLYGQYTWAKGSALPGAFKGRLSPSHEYVFHLNKKSIVLNQWVPTTCGRTSPMRYNVRRKDGKSDKSAVRYLKTHKAPDSVIRVNAVRFGEATGHPAQMPVALAAFLIRTWRKDGCLTYDPFGGSATTLLACEVEGVDGVACEISPAYVELAMARWRKLHPGQRIERVA